MVKRASSLYTPSSKIGFVGRNGTRVSPPKPFRVKNGSCASLVTMLTVAKVGRPLESVVTPEICQPLIKYFENGSVRLVKSCLATNENTRRCR